jgi:hypothetical protein
MLIRPANLLPTLTVLLCALAAPVRAQSVTLRYNWKQGDVLTYKSTVKTTSTMTGGPAGQATFEQTMGQTLKVTVAAVGADGTATLRQEIVGVTLEMNSPAGKVAYDSAKPPASNADPAVIAMSKTMGAMVGEAISVTMAPNGAVRSIVGTQKIIDKLMADLPRDPMAGGLAQNIKAMLGEDALRSSLEQSFSRLPDTPVKPGDTWTAEQSIGADTIGRIVGTSTFTLKAVEGTGDAAVARVAVSLALRQPDAPAAGASMSMRLGKGSGQGELVFRVGPGIVERNSMNTDMASTASVRGPDGNPLSLQNTTRTQMTMELVK